MHHTDYKYSHFNNTVEYLPRRHCIGEENIKKNVEVLNKIITENAAYSERNKKMCI